MRFLVLILLLIVTKSIEAQNKTPEDFGFRHFKTIYQKDTVHILVLSKKGEELKSKPLLLFIQGSLATPLIIIENGQSYSVFPFNTDSLLQNYHLAIISKPYIPIICERKYLKSDFSYTDSATGKLPEEYIKRDYLDYYVHRNIKAIKFLKQQSWITKNKLIVAGHSAGATIAAKLAAESKDITHLIYLNGNPLGRIIAMIAQQRVREKEDKGETEKIFENWKDIVDNPEDINNNGGDTYKTTFDFSFPSPISYLEKLSIPVLIVYSTKDESVLYNDYLKVEMIRKKKNNFTFKTYFGLNHNFFGLKPNGEVDYDKFNWDKIALDWLPWLNTN